MVRRNKSVADWIRHSANPEDTRRLARALAPRLRGGEVILLRGALGAGKTLFTAALAQGLGIESPVLSPTFVLLRSYDAPGGLELHHFDFCRLSGRSDLDSLGIEEFPTEQSITVVEWPERCPGAFEAETLTIDFIVTADEERRLEGRWGSLPFDRSGWPPREAMREEA